MALNTRNNVNSIEMRYIVKVALLLICTICIKTAVFLFKKG